MKQDPSVQGETQGIAPRLLTNNPVADSWQSRMPVPIDYLAAENGHQEALDLVGHTLNGRPIYRAWQLALLLGMSPAVLSTSLGAIPTNLRPFEIFDEDYEANAGRSALWAHGTLKSAGEETKADKRTNLGELRRHVVLARAAESLGLEEVKDAGWEELMDSFHEF